MPINIAIDSLVAGILASLACGLGVLPLFIRGLEFLKRTGIGYGIAGGLMFAASVYNLLLPGLNMSDNQMSLERVLPVVLGIISGAMFIWLASTQLTPEKIKSYNLARFGTRTELLVFIAMSVHSIPEGVAVGVGYASGEVYNTEIGSYIALAIGIHNIPEGLAVAIPLRASGAGLNKCFWAAFLTSLPQPIAAVPASLASWIFQPLMPVLMGFAAGAMIFLVLLELIPEALEDQSPLRNAWYFTSGFCLMILIQVLL